VTYHRGMSEQQTDWRDKLARAQSRVARATTQVDRARQARDQTARDAREAGESIYGIARALGMTQQSVRQILGV